MQAQVHPVGQARAQEEVREVLKNETKNILFRIKTLEKQPRASLARFPKWSRILIKNAKKSSDRHDKKNSASLTSVHEKNIPRFISQIDLNEVGAFVIFCAGKPTLSRGIFLLLGRRSGGGGRGRRKRGEGSGGFSDANQKPPPPPTGKVE